MLRLLFITGCIICLSVVIGCSGSPTDPGTSGVLPSQTLMSADPGAGGYNRYLWGYWNIKQNPQTKKLEATPLRTGELHINIRRWLEETICTTCLVIGDSFINADGMLDVKIGIVHPLSDPVFTGFDVRGIAIFPGTKLFDENKDLVLASYPKEYTLWQPDGYTTLWSPAGFPEGSLGRPIFEYSKGAYAYYTNEPKTTLNPYIAYYTLSDRHALEAGGHDERHFVIRFPENPTTVPLEFGYAVDCSWAKPSNIVNPVVPGDFPPEANSYEAYKVDINLSGTMTPVGGSNLAVIDVHDWQGPSTIKTVQIEGPDLFNGLIEAKYQQTTPDGAAEYTATFTNELKAAPGKYQVLVSVEDTKTVPIIGVVKAFNIAFADVHPIVELEKTIAMANLPVSGVFDPTNATAYFDPMPITPNLQVIGIKDTLDTVTGFPNITTTGGMGFCKGTRQLYIATDLGAGWPNDVTVINVDTFNADYYIDIPSLNGSPGSAPLDFVVDDNYQEVWATLFNENAVGVFPANTQAPNITRIDTGTSPTTMAIDQKDYKVFVVCDGNDTIRVIDGLAKTSLGTINLATPLTSPDVNLPATPGIVYVPASDRIYITTLMAGKVDYYNATDLVYQGSISLVNANTMAIVGLVYDSVSGYIYATGQVSPNGHIWAINPDTNVVDADTTTSGNSPSFPCVDPTSHRLLVPDPNGHVDAFKLNF